MIIGFDYETHLMGPENLFPKPVCLSGYLGGGEVPINEDNADLATRHCGDLEDLAEALLNTDLSLVGANVAFDLGVMGREHPHLVPAIYEAIAEGRVHDVLIREKMLNLALHGVVAELPTPDGGKQRLLYSLAVLASDYLGIDMTAEKKGEDAWRTNYDALEDVPLAEWPEDAITYSVNDSYYPTLIYHLQEERAAEFKLRTGHDVFQSEPFRVMAAYALGKMSAEGVLLDAEEHAKVVAEVQEALTPEKLALLVTEEILRPGCPPRPYKTGARNHVPTCKKKKGLVPVPCDCSYEDLCPHKPIKDWLCDCPPKMKAGTKPSINKAALEAFILDLKKDMPDQVTLAYTPKGNLQADAAFMADHYHLSPVLGQLRDRQKVQKLLTTDLPRMEWPKGSGVPAKVLHTSFDVLKETGRTSSFASKIYPSWNCQNPHPRIRSCIVPRPGYVLYSVDYSSMEFGTLAQKCYDLFGHSVLRDVINKGWDPHAYLGAQLALHLDDGFADSCEREGVSEADEVYRTFVMLKDSTEEKARKFFKHYRTFAKPTGLGYPGGLGAKTFVTYAHDIYGVEVTLLMAKELREVWLRCFPEMRLYLDWVNNNLEDPRHPGGHAYITPLGLYRADASYCAAANGAGLQAPGAEGSLLGVIMVSEATYADPESILANGNHRALLFLHDEIVGEAREEVAHEVCHEVARLMEKGMRVITPDVAARAGPVTMLRWSKAAEAVYVDGRLTPWIPPEEAK